MNAKTVANHYPSLTPEERFRLIVAAGARGDQTEMDRLVRAGRRLTLRMSDHSPWALAFIELAQMVFLEMLEETAKYHDALERWRDADKLCGSDRETDTGHGDEDDVEDEDLEAVDESTCDDIGTADQDDEESLPNRMFDFYLAQGFILKTKVDGWKMFCERLSLPPFGVWQLLPGFQRFRLAVQRLEDQGGRYALVFRAEGMLRWLRKIRPKGAPVPSAENLISANRIADELDQEFRERVAWWGG